MKIKRTGLVPAVISGALLTAAIPILVIISKSDQYAKTLTTPLEQIMQSSWQLIAMVLIMICIISACVIYHIEYQNRAIQHLLTLPISEERVFFSKLLLMGLILFVLLMFSCASVMFVSYVWFTPNPNFILELLQVYGFSYVLCIPVIMISLFLSQLFDNMWIPLGIGVIGYAFAMIVIMKDFKWTYFPYGMPMITLVQITDKQAENLLAVAIGEIIAGSFIEVLFIKIRRYFR